MSYPVQPCSQFATISLGTMDAALPLCVDFAIVPDYDHHRIYHVYVVFFCSGS
jgi:hypothetical protein